MQSYVVPDERPVARLYDAAFTAVGAPNVKHQNVTQMIEPFQRVSRFPWGQPPVRYPDLTTRAGFMDDPAQDASDARNVAGRMAEKYNEEDPMPYQWDGQAVGRQVKQKDHFGTMPRQEMIKRVLMPDRDSHPLMAW